VARARQRWFFQFRARASISPGSPARPLRGWLPDTTLLYGDAVFAGTLPPCLGADGSMPVLDGSGLIELDTASWTVREVQLWRSCRKIESRQLYLTVVSDVPAIQLCDPRGLVDIDTRIADH
jgi:hypothetical protein